MSRALYLPENVSKVDQLKETLSQLPENLVSMCSLSDVRIKTTLILGRPIRAYPHIYTWEKPIKKLYKNVMCCSSKNNSELMFSRLQFLTVVMETWE